ncbi:Dabb family protein [Actinomadura formosensis]|uniref:Dabb family protein n=1 Tax=Actinomadura formosensis TaxID=60706 RepID=UPI00082F7C7B|nr:Dabb family protein [Actinomadura formosensis]
MFRHVVLMTWKQALDENQAARVRTALDDLGARSPDVRSFSHGPDAGVRPGGGDYALVADFDDAGGWRAYSAHPAHDVVREVMRGLVASQAVVQFEFTPAGEGAA